MAIANLVLAGIDVGIGVKEGVTAAKATNQVLSGGGADVIAKLSPAQTRKFQALATSTDDAQKQQLRQSLRQELGDDFDAANKVFKDAELETISDAEADLIYGGFPQSQYEGRTYDSLSPKEKEAFDKVYTIRKNSEAREAVGKPRVIARNPGQVEKGYPPLHFEYDDNGNRIIKTGTDKSSERLSNASRMKTNLKNKLGRKIKPNHQIHHVIPDNRVRGNPLAREAYDRNLYDLDRASNHKELPKRAKPGEIVHRGSHSKWDRHVNEVLNRKQRKLLKDYGVDTVKKLPNTPEANEAIKRVMRSAENQLHKDLVNTELGLNRGWLKREPDGLKLSENDKDFNVVETA